jgi:tripartite motif-containing protein 71
MAAPFDVAVDDSLNIYVADNDNHRIQKFDSSFNYVSQWGSLGTENSQFGNSIYQLAVYISGDILVADNDNKRIQKFSPDGTFLASIPVVFGNMLQSVTSDGAGNIYAGDATQRNIRKYAPN